MMVAVGSGATATADVVGRGWWLGWLCGTHGTLLELASHWSESGGQQYSYEAQI
jgi:hypothetical protein